MIKTHLLFSTSCRLLPSMSFMLVFHAVENQPETRLKASPYEHMLVHFRRTHCPDHVGGQGDTLKGELILFTQGVSVLLRLDILYKITNITDTQSRNTNPIHESCVRDVSFIVSCRSERHYPYKVFIEIQRVVWTVW